MQALPSRRSKYSGKERRINEDQRGVRNDRLDEGQMWSPWQCLGRLQSRRTWEKRRECTVIGYLMCPRLWRSTQQMPPYLIFLIFLIIRSTFPSFLNEDNAVDVKWPVHILWVTKLISKICLILKHLFMYYINLPSRGHLSYVGRNDWALFKSMYPRGVFQTDKKKKPRQKDQHFKNKSM